MADTAARLAISARRNEVARFTIAVTGIDMTGVAMAMQVRLGRDVPGAPLIALATVSTLAAEGLKMDSVTVTNGVPTSFIKGRINASTMTDATKVPYMGEVGADSVLAYAMQWTLNGDPQTRLYGDFIVLGSAFGSENAPTNRPASYGAASSAGATTGGALTFGDQVIYVSVNGIEQLAALIGLAKAEADRSRTGADRASASEVVAGQKAVASEASANRSFASTATSDAAKQAVLDNIANINVQSGLTLQAVSRAALAAITDRPIGRQAYLSEPGREGTFVYLSGDSTAVVASDPDQALYVAPASSPNGAIGVWARRVPDNVYQATWWGAANTTANSIAERDRAQRMINLLPRFAVLNWWRDNIVTKNDIQFQKPITVNFGGFGVVRDPTSGLQGGPTWNVLVIASPDITFIDPYVSGQLSQQAAGNPAAIQISSITTTTPADIRRIKLIRPVIRNCSAGIIIYGDWQNFADRNKYPVKSYPFYYPTDILIENPDVEVNYMGIENFYGSRVTIRGAKIRHFAINGATGFHPSFRFLGATDTLCEDFDVDVGVIPGVTPNFDGSWGFYIAADNGRQQNLNTTIRNGIVRNCSTTFYIDEDVGTISIKNVETRNPLDSTIRTNGLKVIGNDSPGGVQTKVGRLIHHGCTYVGVAIPYDLQGYIGHIDCRDNSFIGNAYTAGDQAAIMFTQFGSNQQKKTGSFINDRFLLKPGPSYRQIAGVSPLGAGGFFRFEGCVMPEVDPTQPGGLTGENPTGTSFMENSPANIATSSTDPGTVNATIPKGSCGRYPAGAWAARL